jgi:maltooligosyltrehalose trehalohydrolase
MSHQFGPHLSADGSCRWKLWAPNARCAELVFFDPSEKEVAAHPMRRDSEGGFECALLGIAVGQRYAYRLDGNPPLPDPASRWQPNGVHRPSAVWRAESFTWSDRDWPNVLRHELVIYELHVGTFTPEGTFAAIVPRLDALKLLGITAIELMPVAQFPGERGWGYDGVDWFAVQQSYGGPEELQRLVDTCHRHGLAVILDVVYNHLGPEGNYLSQFGPFFTQRHHTPWGAAVNFDGPHNRPVRDFVLENVRQWIRDFHVDGLRLDAIHAIIDDSAPHILAEIKQTAEEEARRLGRPVYVIAESNLNDVKLLDAPAQGGYGLDAQWSDDFHHCVHTLLSGERDGYYADFDDPPRQLAKAFTDIFVYDGIESVYRQQKTGRPVGAHPGDQFVVSIQTHDQVGNRAAGDRFGTLLAPAQQRLAVGLFLMAPNIPMLRGGQ